MNKKAYSILVASFALLVLADFVSCSPVQFEKQQLAPQNAGPAIVSPVSCTGGVCTQHHQDTTTGANPQANILFILDTSGSTTDIQASLASNLSGFVNGLSGVDYRIGLITTDVSSVASDTKNNFPDAVNLSGALQDAKLVALSSGSNFLTPQSASTEISAPQIAQAASACVSSHYNAAACLSDDPRAIFAANLFVSGNSGGFIRSGVPTTFVIISDADERNSNSLAPYGYPQGTADAPNTFISNFHGAFPGTPLRVDTLVVQPGDSGCYDQRHGRDGNPLIYGFYAPIYANLAQQTGGVLGSICNSNFTAQLGAMPSAIPASAQINSLGMTCRPAHDAYTLNFTNMSGAPVSAVPSTPDLANKKINLSSPLPVNVKAVLSYDCEV